ncbi:MAG: hypothetical protein NVS9B14_06640 [Candidatus Acidiferrum sp.]
MATATQPIQTATPPPQGEVFDAVGELRKRYPGVANEPDEKIRQHLSNPQNFRSAFPEYGHLDDATITRNMSRGQSAPPQAQAPDNRSFLQKWKALMEAGAPQSTSEGIREGLLTGLMPWRGARPLRDTLKLASDELNKSADQGDMEGLQRAARGEQPKTIKLSGPHGVPITIPDDQAGTRMAADTLSFAGDATRPKNLAIAAAGAVAPELAAGYMLAEGGINVTEAGRDISKEGWTPQATQKLLAGGSEMAGGGAMTTGVVEGGLANTNTAKLLKATKEAVVEHRPPAMLVPEAQKAMTQAIQPGVNIPKAQQSIQKAGPRLQQLRQAGALTDLDGNPISEIKNTEQLLGAVRAAKQHVLGAIEERLGPVAELQVDTSAIAKEMRSSVTKRMREQYPEQAAAIEKRAATYEQPHTLRELEQGIIDANDDLKGFYKQPVQGESSVSGSTRATLAEARAARKLLDQKVEELSGAGVKELKVEYGALRDVERATARQHAVATRTKEGGLWEGLSYLHAAGDVLSGNPLGAIKAGGILTAGKMLKTLRSPDFLIEQSFHGPKAFTAAEAIGKAAGPPAPKGLLPKPATEAGYTQEDASGPQRPQFSQAYGGVSVPSTTPKALLTEKAGQAPPQAPPASNAGKLMKAARGGYSYKPSEKAATMSAPAKDYGPEFKAQEVQEEINRTKAILNNTKATPEDMTAAKARLADLQETTKEVAPTEKERIGRSREETNAIRAELSEMKAKARKWSDKFARARDWRAQNEYRENMEAADRRVNELQEALDKGTPVKLQARGATREELTATYRNLTPEQRAKADELLQEYQISEGPSRQSFIDEYGLNRGAWKGLPIQEKMARIATGEKTGMNADDITKFFQAMKKKQN